MLPDGCTPRAERQVGAEGMFFFNFYCQVYFEHNVTLSFSVSLLRESFLTFVQFTFFTFVFFLEIFIVTTTVFCFVFFLRQKHCIKHHSTLILFFFFFPVTAELVFHMY